MVKIQENIPLAPYTTFKIGGPAKYFVEINGEEALIEAVQYAKDNNIPAFIMGGGSNILISDKGFDGLVIRLVSHSNGNHPIVKMWMENGNYFLECWTGENLSSILRLASEASLSGLEWLAGIPGTVGGAVRGNAGAGTLGGPMSTNIKSVKVLDVSDNLERNRSANWRTKFKIFKNEACKFDYRESIFKHNSNIIIVSAVLRLQKGNKEEIEKKIREIIGKRTEKFPKEPSPGSFFKNPTVKNEEIRRQFETDAGMKSKDDKIPAGWLIAEAGFLGKKVGKVQVSESHGNFVVNLGGGKAEEIIMLSSMIKQKVREKFDIQLFEEVQLVGF